MDRKAYYKRLFIVGAIWNWGAAILFFFWSAQVLAMLKMQPLNYTGAMQLAMGLVFAQFSSSHCSLWSRGSFICHPVY